MLCKRNQPIVEIRPLRALPDAFRRVGLAKDIFEVPASFFEPVAAIDHRGLRRRPFVILICQAIGQGLVRTGRLKPEARSSEPTDSGQDKKA